VADRLTRIMWTEEAPFAGQGGCGALNLAEKYTLIYYNRIPRSAMRLSSSFTSKNVTVE